MPHPDHLMRAHRRGALLLLLGLFLIPTPSKAQNWPQIYDPLRLQIMEMYLQPADWNKIRADETFDIEVPAVIRLIGEAWMLVSVRRKSGTPVGSKISLKIDINELVPGQSWHGVKKLSLENGDDADVLAEGFAWYLHRVASRAATSTAYLPGMAAWTALLVNGSYVGVYVNVEQPDKTFLKNRRLYAKNTTWLYKMSNINSPEIKVGEGSSPQSGLLCYSPFVEARNNPCQTPDPANLAQLLPQQVDVEALLMYAAVSAFHAGPDQMFSHGKNFYYLDSTIRRRMYIPWDLDSVFGDSDESIFGRRKGNKLSQTNYQKVLLENPTFKARYKVIMGRLVNGVLSPSALRGWLTRLETSSLLPLALKLDPNGKLSSNPGARFDALRKWVGERAASIKKQLQ